MTPLKIFNDRDIAKTISVCALAFAIVAALAIIGALHGWRA